DVSLDTAPYRCARQALRAGTTDAAGRRAALSAALGAHRPHAGSAEGRTLSQRWAHYCSAHENYSRVGRNAKEAWHFNAQADPLHRRAYPNGRRGIDTRPESVSRKPLISQPKSSHAPSHREHEPEGISMRPHSQQAATAPFVD